MLFTGIMPPWLTPAILLVAAVVVYIFAIVGWRP
jgi:hypothetical protein